VPKTAAIVFLAMIKIIAIKLAKFLIAKSLKQGPMYLISIICMLLIACRIKQLFIVIEELKVELSRIVNKAISIARYPV